MSEKKERIVLEIDPQLKTMLQMALLYEHLTIKEKLTQLITEYVGSIITTEESEEQTNKMKITINQ
ncbi:MAG: hypothetical protein Q8K02_08145 [Flavobacterium sp.]|nr:hypothetical protein [Flavobacterium sp.]